MIDETSLLGDGRASLISKDDSFRSTSAEVCIYFGGENKKKGRSLKERGQDPCFQDQSNGQKETTLMVHRAGRGVCEQEPDSAARPGPAEGVMCHLNFI